MQHPNPNDDTFSRSYTRRNSGFMPDPQTMDNVLVTRSPSMRDLARELLEGTSMRSRRSIVDVRYTDNADNNSTTSRVGAEDEVSYMLDNESQTTSATSYGATLGNLEEVEEDHPLMANQTFAKPTAATTTTTNTATISMWEQLLNQVTAVAVICLLNIMIAVPFGASYFPVGWKANGDEEQQTGEQDGDDVHGMFPLQGKQALGIRMFLFATVMGQLAFTFASKFTNPVGMQMVENVPFLHALCHTVIEQQGYGKEALSTVFFLFGLSSVVVGLTFYLLGKWHLGRIVYFFPNHVLVGCIGGIGAFLAITATEVTSDVTFTFDMDGLVSLAENFHLLAVVLAFEGTLRVLMYLTQDEEGHSKYPYLSPLYYCSITPLFYLGLVLFGVSVEQATEIGFFFPATAGGDTDSVWQDDSLWDIFQVIDLSTISWMAVFQSTGTMVALAAFSLIHVPINIPAFAISTDVEVDMNAELVAHGYANCLSGMFGGLQNYITYSNSVLYAKSGGNGKISSLAIVALTMVLFVVGPDYASYLPRCMAGTLLLHLGIDLILEGVYDCTCHCACGIEW
jgi:SulP family sulfate permease